jgi:hypothetical protein
LTLNASHTDGCEMEGAFDFECIPYGWLCDGYPDCSSNEDEDPYICLGEEPHEEGDGESEGEAEEECKHDIHGRIEHAVIHHIPSHILEVTKEVRSTRDEVTEVKQSLDRLAEVLARIHEKRCQRCLLNTLKSTIN